MITFDVNSIDNRRLRRTVCLLLLQLLQYRPIFNSARSPPTRYMLAAIEVWRRDDDAVYSTPTRLLQRSREIQRPQNRVAEKRRSLSGWCGPPPLLSNRLGHATPADTRSPPLTPTICSSVFSRVRRRMRACSIARGDVMRRRPLGDRQMVVAGRQRHGGGVWASDVSTQRSRRRPCVEAVGLPIGLRLTARHPPIAFVNYSLLDPHDYVQKYGDCGALRLFVKIAIGLGLYSTQLTFTAAFIALYVRPTTKIEF